MVCFEDRVVLAHAYALNGLVRQTILLGELLQNINLAHRLALFGRADAQLAAADTQDGLYLVLSHFLVKPENLLRLALLTE